MKAHRHLPNVLVVTSVFVTLAFVSSAFPQAVLLKSDDSTNSPGASSSRVNGIALSGWLPLTMTGWEMYESGREAVVWEAPGGAFMGIAPCIIDPASSDESWGNAVMHTSENTGGEYTMVVGVREDASGTPRPMTWDNVKHKPWNARSLPTLNAGDGEAFLLFKPDGTPLRAIACGWSGELPPMAATNDAAASTMKLRIPILWEVTTTGERILRPDFGVGLEGIVLGICSSGLDGYHAAGGGDDGTGAWVPQLWSSSDAETWTNESLPLPAGMTAGEAVSCHWNAGILVVGGWGQSAGGPVLPVVWERDFSEPLGTWIVHELPVPVGGEGGQNIHIHKRPGRVKYSSTQPSTGNLILWVRDSGDPNWTRLEPSDYLVNPSNGTPIAGGGFDDFGRVAATVMKAPPTSAANTTAGAQTDTVPAVLIPEPPVTVDPTPTVASRIVLTASPNPFNPTVHIRYTLPRTAPATVTIHDATGREVARVADGVAAAGVVHTTTWNGLTNTGTRAASGVYFARVATASQNATVKIVLAK